MHALFRALAVLSRPIEAAPVALSSLFGGGAKPPPPVPPPQPMPDLASPALLAQKQRDMEAAAARSGRASTILTSGDDYSKTKLGTA